MLETRKKRLTASRKPPHRPAGLLKADPQAGLLQAQHRPAASSKLPHQPAAVHVRSAYSAPLLVRDELRS